MLIGNNIALVVYGFYMGSVVMRWFAGYHNLTTGLSGLLIHDFVDNVNSK